MSNNISNMTLLKRYVKYISADFPNVVLRISSFRSDDVTVNIADSENHYKIIMAIPEENYRFSKYAISMSMSGRSEEAAAGNMLRILSEFGDENYSFDIENKRLKMVKFSSLAELDLKLSALGI